MDRDRSAMPIFMSSRARPRHTWLMTAAAVVVMVAAVALRLV